MRILLDENVSSRFGKLLVGHEVSAVAGSELRSIPDERCSASLTSGSTRS